ncbi:MAG: hypothetical protein R3D84_18070 [Paracoccaceae bacterium]
MPTGDIPNDWQFHLFEDDYDHFEQHGLNDGAALEGVGVRR